MTRLTFLSTALFVVGLYAWKDWYKSLCALIVLMAFLEHHDMPRTMFGIQGLNPWNLLLLVIILAWLAQRGREGLVGHPPGTFVLLLISFLAVVTIAFVRLMLDRQALPTDASTAGLISDYLVNPVKWIIPGLLLFDGCRSRSRLLWGLVSILSLYVLLSVQVIRWMPIDALFDAGTLVSRSQRRLLAEIGYHRVDLSVILAGASWALFAARTLAVSRARAALVLITAGVVLLAQALTGGRGGYLAWAVVGLTLSLLRWRWCLFLAPALAIVVSLLPGVGGRATEGLFGSADAISSHEVDIERLTAGRNLVWPLVVDKIAEEPIFGYGRAAMERTGLSSAIEGEDPIANPHSAYLEMLLDNGWIGLAVTLALFAYVLARSLSLMRDHRSPVFVAVGGVASSLVIALLAGSVSGESFYPREGMLGMWSAIGLMMRVSAERARANLSFGMHRRSSSPTLPTRPADLWRPADPLPPRPETRAAHGPVAASPGPRPIDALPWN